MTNSLARHAHAARRRLAVLHEAIASRLWPVPLITVAVAVILGMTLPELDRLIDPSLPQWLAELLFGGGSTAARSVLSTIAGSLITATSLTFSLTVVALQLASSQASPRLLRLFASDPMVHSTLATFLGTFVYALMVLRTVDDQTATTDLFVPRISITIANLATLASVVMLTLFLAHLARALRVETMMRDVHRQSSVTISLMTESTPGSRCQAPKRPKDARVVTAPRSGFLGGVERESLIKYASKQNLVVRELHPIGDSVIEGTPLLEWWPLKPRPVRPDSDQEIAEHLTNQFEADYERTSQQDIGFGLRQLADVAAKALSPGINDPTTAVHALGHVSSLLGDLAEKDLRADAYADDDGNARLIPCGGQFADFVEVGIEQVRRYGVSDPTVAERLLTVLEEVAWRADRPDQRKTLATQLARLQASIDHADFDDVERKRLAGRARAVRDTLKQLPSPRRIWRPGA